MPQGLDFPSFAEGATKSDQNEEGAVEEALAEDKETDVAEFGPEKSDESDDDLIFKIMFVNLLHIFVTQSFILESFLPIDVFHLSEGCVYDASWSPALHL
ncbi:hypothetical protein CK203_069619 [Vitis vinifera]|uniref:Uncharacterized protein n=1 Tax=Vitis vinifera TaxID=29760 RepID=A0A438EKZ8_VITVI|nr:hypothetical protein CK203_069619 [Vitis vinifera]